MKERLPEIVLGIATAAVVAILVVIFLFPPPEMVEGVVVDKDHDSPWSRTINNQTTYHPESWQLRIRGTSKDGEQETGWMDTTEAIYEDCREGDWWTATGGCTRGDR